MPAFELKPMGSTNDKRVGHGAIFMKGGGAIASTIPRPEEIVWTCQRAPLLAYRQRRLLPLLFSAGARVPPGPESPDAPDSEGRRYNARVLAAGGWAKYEGAHRARLTKTFASKFPSLPEEMVSKVVSYAFHTGWY